MLKNENEKVEFYERKYNICLLIKKNSETVYKYKYVLFSSGTVTNLLCLGLER